MKKRIRLRHRCIAVERTSPYGPAAWSPAATRGRCRTKRSQPLESLLNTQEPESLLMVFAAPLLAQPNPRLFDYDATLRSDARLAFVPPEPGAKISELTTPAPWRPCRRLLVEPATQTRRRPRHRVRTLGTWNRTEFLPEALSYARAGAVSVLINYPWTRQADSRRRFDTRRPGRTWTPRGSAVVELRRAIDSFAARPDVDSASHRLYSHSYGAQWGAISRHRQADETCVLMGGAAARPTFGKKHRTGMASSARSGPPRSGTLTSNLLAARWDPPTWPLPAPSPSTSVRRSTAFFDQASMNPIRRGERAEAYRLVHDGPRPDDPAPGSTRAPGWKSRSASR